LYSHGPPPPVITGEWQCISCDTVNLSGRVSCIRCQGPCPRPFSPTVALEPQICERFERGFCQQGDTCPFIHSERAASIHHYEPPVRRSICDGFERGYCERGDLCPLIHSERAAALQPPDEPRRRSRSSSRRYERDYTEVPPPPPPRDRSYERNERGRDDHYRAPVKRSQTVCQYFSAGYCSRGDQCTFLHPAEAALPEPDDRQLKLIKQFFPGRPVKGSR